MSTPPRVYKAIGLMSGTSLDGIDVALIETDGASHVKPLGFSYYPYESRTRDSIRQTFGAQSRTDAITAAEKDLTIAHINAVKEFLSSRGLQPGDVDLIGFHGQTITHDPDNRFTWQLGAGDLLARETGIEVVYDFRSADVAAGGQGAPLIPVYHRARAASSGVLFPVAIVNIGGVSNVTWIGREEKDILAFDCGPGNALIDDIVLKHTGNRFDKDGAIAKSGQVDTVMLAQWLSHSYFEMVPPKSLDRDAWTVAEDVASLPFADAVATLTAFTVQSIAQATDFFPQAPRTVYVAGGGRLNATMMDGLSAILDCPVLSVDTLGWDGDALEAEGFAYLAVRSVLGLPLSFPTTTGCPIPQTGGKRAKIRTESV